MGWRDPILLRFRKRHVKTENGSTDAPLCDCAHVTLHSSRQVVLSTRWHEKNTVKTWQKWKIPQVDVPGSHSHLKEEPQRARARARVCVCHETCPAFLWLGVQSSAPGSFPFTFPALQRQRPAQQRGGLLLCRIASGQSLLGTTAPELEVLYEIQCQGNQRGDEQCDHAQPQRVLRPEAREAGSFTLRHRLQLKTVGTRLRHTSAIQSYAASSCCAFVKETGRKDEGSLS